MADTRRSFEVRPFPRLRELTVDGGRLAARKHSIHALIEVDVTTPRRLIREHEARTGEKLSFTAFVIACLGQAVELHRSVHAYRDWRNRLILFDEVDVNTMIDAEVAGHRTVLAHFLRAVNKRSVRDLHDEIRAVRSKPQATREAKGIVWITRLPRFVRDLFYWALFKNPQWVKAMFGTVSVTAVGMFGKGGGWGIPFGIHTLAVTLGGIAEKPGVIDGRIEIREYLDVTLTFDHDIVDGAPAARFTQRLRELIESGYGLEAT
jgi:pyruvate/2-oxoglutarate dehydrogenase complex dihydrolipoamide acyltransferase (E2) component